MSALESPPRPDMRCPHCRAAVADEQEWCLECGQPLRRHVVNAKGSRGLARVLPLLAAAVAGALVALLVSSLLGGSDEPPRRAASTTPTAPQTRPAGAPASDTSAATPQAATPPPPASATSQAAPPEAPLWPSGSSAYTVVLMSSPNPADAAKRARALARNGADAGVLRSDDYDNFPLGRWVVWRGRYQQKAKADEALAVIRRAGRRGYVTYVRPRR